MEGVRRNLGVGYTIFEEEEEEENDELHSLYSPSLSSPSSPLQSGVDTWTRATGREPDVKVHVQGECFHLHKDALSLQSNYLKRKLTESSELNLSPPLNITPNTFKLIADFCYTTQVLITPFNVAALVTAAEVLEMTENSVGGGERESLRERVESYFSVVVATNEDFALIVLRSCLSLLPEVEDKVFLFSRCLEVLLEMNDDDSNGRCGDVIKKLEPRDFRIIVNSMRRRFSDSHDLLYRVVDLYLKEYNGKKMTEEEKIQICNTIDSNLLSPHLLHQAVHNPTLPLRFLLHAILSSHLHTHRSLFSSSANQPPPTLAAVLHRDGALRQLRTSVDSTRERILALEREISGMKQTLVESEKQRSASFRLTGKTEKRVERGERGSVSASMMRFGKSRDFSKKEASSNLNFNLALDSNLGGGKRNWSIGQRLMKGLKGAFGLKNKGNTARERGGDSGFHHRSSSGS